MLMKIRIYAQKSPILRQLAGKQTFSVYVAPLALRPCLSASLPLSRSRDLDRVSDL